MLLISKPYMERRTSATCRALWPEVDVVCAWRPLDPDACVRSIGDGGPVVDMLVGDLQRVMVTPNGASRVEQHVPAGVRATYDRLVAAGFDSRLLR